MYKLHLDLPGNLLVFIFKLYSTITSGGYLGLGQNTEHQK